MPVKPSASVAWCSKMEWVEIAVIRVLYPDLTPEDAAEVMRLTTTPHIRRRGSPLRSQAE